MNREIKYRVWDSKRKQFPTDTAFVITQRGNVYDVDGIRDYNKTHTVQFHTGHKDRSGKDIYEGDIVKLNYDTSDVHWSACKAQVVWWMNVFYFEVNGGVLAQDTYYWEIYSRTKSYFNNYAL